MVGAAIAIATTAAATHDAPMPRLRSQSIDARSVAVLGAARPNAASPERPVATAASDGIVAVSEAVHARLFKAAAAAFARAFSRQLCFVFAAAAGRRMDAFFSTSFAAELGDAACGAASF